MPRDEAADRDSVLATALGTLRDDLPAAPGLNHWPSTVRLVSFQGDSTLLEVTFGDRTLMVRHAGESDLSEGRRVHACVSPANVRCYPRSAAHA